MKILVLGGSGMLGHKLVQILGDQFDVWTTLRGDLKTFKKINFYDASKTFDNVEAGEFQKIKEIANRLKPDVIINAVGIIKQIPSAKNVVETLTINSILPHKLAELANENGARLITVSTDCVFRGDQGDYAETDVSDATDLYGKSKNLGEVAFAENCLTVRTSIIGREIGSAHSLLEWFLSNRGGKVKGYANAVYTGFPTIVFAGIIADLIANHKNLHGLYHVSSEPINKYDLLKTINEKYKTETKIERDENFKIDRSLNSDKFRNETGFVPPNWETMIEMMANDPTPYEKWRKLIIR